MQVRRFTIRYSPRLLWLFELVGLGPRHALVEVRGDALVVRMGWAFRGVVPLRDVASVTRERRDVWWAIGVHTNLGGSWLVNGSATGIVTLALREPVKARCSGLSVTVRRLGLGLDDSDGFIEAMGASV